jgi:hypothetical protein
MTDNPHLGPVHQPGHRRWSTHPTTRIAPNTRSPQTRVLLRSPQRAPSGAGIKDLRPLRGRPSGPILDPDASPRRAQEQAENGKEDQKTKNPSLAGLTGPAPSGMTARNACAIRLTGGNRESGRSAGVVDTRSSRFSAPWGRWRLQFSLQVPSLHLPLHHFPYLPVPTAVGADLLTDIPSLPRRTEGGWQGGCPPEASGPRPWAG